MKENTENKFNETTLSLIYTECKAAFDQEIARISFLDQKSNMLLVLIGIIIGIGVLNIESISKLFLEIKSNESKAFFIIIYVAMIWSLDKSFCSLTS